MAKQNEMVAVNDVTALVAQMTGQLPKATHAQSIKAVMAAIEIEQDEKIAPNLKRLATKMALGIVKNSDSIELAEQASASLRMRKLLEVAQNQIQELEQM